ncbi:hypothetical protein H2203_005296 [Taxawa tesnikishii (nom. ined.)]|nr:hypothetical protein H2203_005296 [Dothideales sp. JES 119]
MTSAQYGKQTIMRQRRDIVPSTVRLLSEQIRIQTAVPLLLRTQVGALTSSPSTSLSYLSVICQALQANPDGLRTPEILSWMEKHHPSDILSRDSSRIKSGISATLSTYAKGVNPRFVGRSQGKGREGQGYLWTLASVATNPLHRTYGPSESGAEGDAPDALANTPNAGMEAEKPSQPLVTDTNNYSDASVGATATPARRDGMLQEENTDRVYAGTDNVASEKLAADRRTAVADDHSGTGDELDTGNSNGEAREGMQEEGERVGRLLSSTTAATVRSGSGVPTERSPPQEPTLSLSPNENVLDQERSTALPASNQRTPFSSPKNADLDDPTTQELIMIGRKVKEYQQHRRALRLAEEELGQCSSDVREAETGLASQAKRMEDICAQIETLQREQRDVQQRMQDLNRSVGERKLKLEEVEQSRGYHLREMRQTERDLGLSRDV